MEAFLCYEWCLYIVKPKHWTSMLSSCPSGFQDKTDFFSWCWTVRLEQDARHCGMKQTRMQMRLVGHDFIVLVSSACSWCAHTILFGFAFAFAFSASDAHLTSCCAHGLIYFIVLSSDHSAMHVRSTQRHLCTGCQCICRLVFHARTQCVRTI